jgi:KUP system potassium uptake protein
LTQSGHSQAIKIITTIKYVNFAMRVDNDGEGGIIALMSLLGVKKQQRPAIVAVGLFGAALIYGDGAITPAISVLSALEGLEHRDAGAHALRAAGGGGDPARAVRGPAAGHGADRRAFGPVMLSGSSSWRCSASTASPASRRASRSTRSTARYLFSGGAHRVSGARRRVPVRHRRRGALCRHGPFRHRADPARLVRVVFPSLVLNYAGQAAIVLEGAPTDGNIFYRLCPAPLLTPLIVLATVATIIASQSIITGAFSMTRQAIQLGWLPRLHDQADLGGGLRPDLCRRVNWLLMIVTLGLTIGFGKSDNLAAAYGIAVSLTMLMTRCCCSSRCARSGAGGLAGVSLCHDGAQRSPCQ